MIFFTIAVGFALIYMAIQFQYIYYWKKIEPVVVPNNFIPSIGVSIILVVRNESDTIGDCLHGILSQHYPSILFEIIIIDDSSTDETVRKILSFQDKRIQLLHLSDFPEYIHVPAYKKSAITLGVDMARFNMIIVTDGDCLYSPDWIRSVVYHFEKKDAVFQTAPVRLLPGKSLLEQMQETEMLTYMLITGAGIQSGWHEIANGANMAFTKEAFNSVQGYEGNYQYASGDDMFLIEKMKKAYTDKINFAKSIDATVLTKGKTNWTDLLKQRIRWASKNKGLANKTIFLIWFFVGLYHFSLLLFLLLAIFRFTGWMPFLLMISFKWVADYFIVQQAAGFFNRLSVLRNFIFLQFMFTFYIFRITLFSQLNKKTDWNR